jgi:hypothetical protein
LQNTFLKRNRFIEVKTMDLNNILEDIGGFGWYQRLLTLA